MGISRRTVLDFVAGDKDAIEKVYLEYKNLMFFVIANYVSSKSDIDDILSEAFIKAVEGVKNVEDPNKLKAFLTTIAKNQALDFLKKNKPVLCSDVIEDIYGEEDKSNDFLSLIEPLLTNKETIVVYYKIYFSYTWQEIVKETGIPETTARRLYESAKEKLKKGLVV
jgi:RNA polymerase sigma-70 factor (ECF subfamily)